MRQALDLASWPRREHFAFFRAFTEPFFGVTVEVRCDVAWRGAKARGDSFYLTYLHAALQAANEIEPFRYRIEGNAVWRYDRVDVSATVGREDGTFGFSYIPFDPRFDVFATAAATEIARVRATSGLALPTTDAAVIHASALPWLQFTGLSHARHHGWPDASPKLSFGRVFERDGARMLPVAIHVHHALMDGLHVGLFVDRLQALLEPG